MTGEAAEAPPRVTRGYAWVCVIAVSGTDVDADGIFDDMEAFVGSHFLLWDSDGDGMSDGWELWNGLDPGDRHDVALDVDGDTLSSLDEYLLGTDPYSRDSDGDGYWDSFEYAQSTNPRSPSSYPVSQSPGDLNCDGYVDAIDVQLAISAVLGMTPPVPSDVNLAGVTDALDLQWIINSALGAT